MKKEVEVITLPTNRSKIIKERSSNRFIYNPTLYLLGVLNQ